MGDITYGTRPGAVALLTTQLDSLTTGHHSAFGPEIIPGTTTNLTIRALRGDLIFKLASSSLVLTTSSFVSVFFVPKIDGTNYPELTAGASGKLAESNYYVGAIRFWPGTIPAKIIYEGLQGVPIPNAPFKTVLKNNLGVTIPSGSTLDLYPQMESVAA